MNGPGAADQSEAESEVESEPVVDVEGGYTPTLADIGAQLAGVLQELSTVGDRLAKLEPAEQVGASLRQLRDQLEQSRRQEWRPLYLDLILLMDRVEQGVTAWPDDPSIGEFVTTIRDEIGEILARRGVTPLDLADTRFDPNRQRAVKVEPTNDPAADRQVVDVVRRGYQSEGYLLRPEEVVVARYGNPGKEG